MSVDEGYIYKYMNFKVFKKVMKTRTLRISKVLAWDDKYEMKLTKLFLRIINNGNLGKYINDIVLSSIYAQSWTGSKESAYMWDNYAQRDGVRIKLKKEKVRERIEAEVQKQYSNWEVHSFLIKYPDNAFDDRYQPISSSIDVRNINSDFILNDLKHKRLNFWAEKEYRYVVINRKIIDDLHRGINEGHSWKTYLGEIPKFIEYEIEYPDIEEVLIGKNCEESKQEEIIDICQTNNLQYRISSHE